MVMRALFLISEEFILPAEDMLDYADEPRDEFISYIFILDKNTIKALSNIIPFRRLCQIHSMRLLVLL
jgi:hypothetical protein